MTRRERGSASLELAIVTPALVMLMLFAVAVGRLAQARNDVYGAASEAARAASVRQSADDAAEDARATATTALAIRGTSCERLEVRADTAGMVAGGQVSVEIGCLVGLRELAMLRLPAARWVHVTAVEVIDRYRGD